MSISTTEVVRLKEMLAEHASNEKHIGYHILPEYFNAWLKGSEQENKYVFFERERFHFFKTHVDFSAKRVIDIGCNIGYFLFDILDAGAEKVTGYEGKASCGEFIRRAITLRGAEDKFNFKNEYYQFNASTAHYDVGILLNVLHHLGDDFGSTQLSIDNARKLMLDHLNELSRNVDTLIFQIGFNWKGDRHACLFEQGTKAELIDFIRKGTRDHWDIQHIGIAEGSKTSITYAPLSEKNSSRDDSLGEFLNRPLFILKSKQSR